MQNGTLGEIAARLEKLTIHELRQLARAVGVRRPADGKKERIKEAVLDIACGRVSPEPPSLRGAPPKSTAYDEKLAADVLAYRKFVLSLKDDEEVQNSSVSDGKILGEEREVVGLLKLTERGYVLALGGSLDGENEVPVHDSFITRYKLKVGDKVSGTCKRTNPAEGFGFVTLKSINGKEYLPDEKRRDFSELTHVYPRVLINSAHFSEDIYCRMIDIFSPIALGQRVFLMTPPVSGKITLIKQIATGISLNYSNFKVIVLVLDELPEVITDYKRSLSGAEFYYTTFDMPKLCHMSGANLIFERAKRLAEEGDDVVLLFDGVGRLSDAGFSEEEINRLLYSACNAEEGGSLTVISTLHGDGENFLRLANASIKLSENLYRAGVLPDLDISCSYSDCAVYLPENISKAAAKLRKEYAGDEEGLIKLFKETDDNGKIYG